MLWSIGVRRRITTVLLMGALAPLAAACGPSSPVNTVATATSEVAAAVTTSPAATEAGTEAPAAVATTEAVTATAAATEALTSETATATEGPTTTTEASAETSTATTATEATAEMTTAPAGTEQAAGGKNVPAFGAAAHLYYVDRPKVLKLAADGGFEWIRQQVPWKDTEREDRFISTEELDRIVASVHDSGRKLLLSIAKAPDFLTTGKGDNGLPKNPEDFARFAETLAQRYKGRVQAIEVWNEQNLAVENGGRVVPEDAARYVEMLKAAYTRIKAVDPKIIVVLGALSSTGVNKPDVAVDDLDYLKAMYAYKGGEIRNYFDVQGFHPANTLNTPNDKFPESPGQRPAGCTDGCWQNAPTHYFRHIEDVRKVMVDSGMGDKKIWITEMGWATRNTTPGYEYGNFVSLQQQADYLEGALSRIVGQYGDWVSAVFIWNLNFAPLWQAQGDPLQEQASFGLLNPDWSPRPAYNKVKQFIAAVHGGP